MITTACQTPYEMLPTRVVKDQVGVFEEEDMAIQIDNIMGTEIDKTCKSLQEFIKIQSASQNLEDRAAKVAPKTPFDKGYQVHVNCETQSSSVTKKGAAELKKRKR